MGKVLPSKFGKGYYYPYKDDAGKDKGLPIQEWTYRAYYDPGYLTDDMLDELLAGKKIEFEVPGKGGAKKKIKASLKPYVTARGYKTNIIEFESDEEQADEKIIEKNAEKITLSYYDASGKWTYNWAKPQQVVDSLGLSHMWKTYADKTWYYDDIDNPSAGNAVRCYYVSVYQTRNRKKNFTFYGKVYKNKAEMISEEQYKLEEKKAEEYADALHVKHAKEAEELRKQREAREKLKQETEEVRKRCEAWENTILKNVYGKRVTEYLSSIEPFVAGISVSDTDLAALVNANHYVSVIDYAFSSPVGYHYEPLRNTYITIEHHTDADVEACKKEILRKLAVYVKSQQLHLIRSNLYNAVKNTSLEEVVDCVDVDTALDIGRFREVKRILNKNKSDPIHAICFNLFEEIFDARQLHENILNMLKVYYDFFDMPEKDRQSVAKFIAVHKLSEYYERISKFDDVLETLIDNSRDPKLTKPLLESIAGTPRANVLKDKTYYFEKRGRLKGDILLYKPIELVEDLRDCIKEFNVSSSVAVLTNIVLDFDETFIFQFYTFAEAEGDESGFDGRRMLNLTKIYNRAHPDAKIGFNFDHGSASDSDTDDT